MNHSIWRKTLSLLLALVMVMGMVCTTALADEITCTCGAEDDTHQESCPLYVAPEEAEVCETCGKPLTECEGHEEQPEDKPAEEPEDGDISAALDAFNDAVASMGDTDDVESTLAALEAIEAAYAALSDEEKASVAEQWDYIQGYAEQVRAGNPDEGVDTLDETEQTEAQKLIAAAQAGGEYTLNEDVTLSTSIEITKDFTLSLNGHTITNSVEEARPFIVNQPVSFTINGTTEGSSMVIPETNTKAYGFVDLKVAAKLTVNGGTYTGNVDYASLFKVRAEGSEVKLTDVNATTNYQITGCDKPSSFEITGGNYHITEQPGSNLAAFYFGNTDDVQLSNVNLTVTSCIGVEIDKSKADIENCTFSSTGTKNSYFTTALAASGNSTVNVKGGSFTSTNGVGIYVFSSGGTINVDGATISGGSESIHADVDKNAYPNATASVNLGNVTVTGKIGKGGSGSEKVSIAVESGTFTDAGDISAYIAPSAVMGEDNTVRPRTENDESTVAQVGEGDNAKYYASLKDAITAAKTGETVTLLDNVDTGNNYTMVNKAVTLNLNGKTITSTAEFTLACTRNATITNGTVANTQINKGKAIYVQKANITIDNAIIQGPKNGNDGTAGIMLGNGAAEGYWGSATIKNNSTVIGGYSGVSVVGPARNNAATSSYTTSTLTVENSAISGDCYGVSGNGLYDVTEIVLNSGAKVSAAVGIYHPQQGKLTINSGAEISGQVGVQACAGETVINDGAVITSTATQSFGNPVKPAEQADGSIQDGSALSVLSRQAYGDVSVTVNGGTFETGNTENKAVVMYGAEKKGNEWVFTFEKEGFKTKASTTISGGTFSSDVSGYCASGYTTQENGNNTWTVIVDESKAVARIGDVKYLTLQAAINAAKKGDTVVLLKDISETVGVAAGKDIILDLNSKTLQNGGKDSKGNPYIITVQNLGTLTIQDNSAEQTGTIKSTGADDAIDNYGTLNVEAGAIEGGTAWYGIYAGKDSITNVYGTAKVTGEYWGIAAGNGSETAQINVYGNAEITSRNPAGTNGGISASKATTQVYGDAKVTGPCGINTNGSLIISDNAYIEATHENAGTAIGLYAGADVKVEGGTIKGGAYGISGNGTSDGTTVEVNGGTISGVIGIYHPQEGTLTINGGEITGQLGVQMCDGTLTISGGEITGTGEDESATKTGDGAIIDGAAVSLVNRTNYGTPKATITGGRFTSEHAAAVAVYGWSNSNPAKTEWTPTKEEVAFTGGTFSSDVDDYCADGYVSHTVSTPANYWNVHQPVSGWHFNASEHWQGCNDVNCTEGRTSVGSHTWNNGVVTTQPTYDAEGVRTYTCGVCNRTRTESIDRLVYTGGGYYPSTPTPTPPVVDITDPDVPLAELPLPFEDVKDGDWYREAVAYVYSNGLMVGTSDTLFGVNTNTSRGMMATVIYRLEKEPNTTFKKIFSDVDNGMWYSNPITWANANKVAVGYDDGSFGPNDNVTREQLIAMLYRYASNKGYDVSKRADLSVFADTGKVSGYAEEAMSWAVAVGLIQGRGASKLAPTDLALRVEVATIFQRFASLYEAETLA